MNTPTQQTAIEIRKVCNDVADMLIKKNESYGDSALNPIRCFSKVAALEGIRVRLDDKISRLIKGNGSFNEDTEMDIMGYLILLRIARQRAVAATDRLNRPPEVEREPVVEDPMKHHDI